MLAPLSPPRSDLGQLFGQCPPLGDEVGDDVVVGRRERAREPREDGFEDRLRSGGAKLGANMRARAPRQGQALRRRKLP